LAMQFAGKFSRQHASGFGKSNVILSKGGGNVLLMKGLRLFLDVHLFEEKKFIVMSSSVSQPLHAMKSSLVSVPLSLIVADLMTSLSN
jgi:hypothetical protein